MPRTPLSFKHREPKHARAWIRDAHRRQKRETQLTIFLILITIAAFIALVMSKVIFGHI